MKLDLGAGRYLRPGYVGVDRYELSRASVQADLLALPFRSDSVDKIRCSHVLEHLAKKDVLPALREMYRVLKPGGFAIILVPDLAYCVQQWLDNRDNTGWYLDIIFGNQEHEGEFHKTGFTETTLRATMEHVGFVTTIHPAFSHNQDTIVARGSKKNEIGD